MATALTILIVNQTQHYIHIYCTGLIVCRQKYTYRNWCVHMYNQLYIYIYTENLYIFVFICDYKLCGFLSIYDDGIYIFFFITVLIVRHRAIAFRSPQHQCIRIRTRNTFLFTLKAFQCCVLMCVPSVYVCVCV